MLPRTPSSNLHGGCAVKKLIKFVLVVAFVFGGWTLAAASLHVVRGGFDVPGLDPDQAADHSQEHPEL